MRALEKCAGDIAAFSDPGVEDMSPESSNERHRTAGFKLRRFGELELRPPTWLVRDLLETDSLALLFGDPAAGKSFLALDLAASIATGAAFHGRGVSRPGPVVYIAGEGHNGLVRRLRAWSLDRKIDLAGAPLLVSTLPAILCEPRSIAEIEVAIAAAAEEVGAMSLVILDTWSRNIGGDENSSVDTALAVSALDRLRAPWRAAGLVVHHVGHGDKLRARGSTVLRGAVDLELRVERGRDGLIRVDCTKAKDIALPPPMAFSLRDVALGLLDEDGRPVVSAVLDLEEYRPEEAPHVPNGRNQSKALVILKEIAARQSENAQASGRSASDARVSLANWRDACAAAGIDRRRFSEVKRALFEAGAVLDHGAFVALVLSENRPNMSESVRPASAESARKPYKGFGGGSSDSSNEWGCEYGSL